MGIRRVSRLAVVVVALVAVAAVCATAAYAATQYFGPAFISPGLPKTKSGAIITETSNQMAKNGGAGDQCRVRLTNSGGSTIAGTDIQAMCSTGASVVWNGSVSGRPVCQVGSPSAGFNATCTSQP